MKKVLILMIALIFLISCNNVNESPVNNEERDKVLESRAEVAESFYNDFNQKNTESLINNYTYSEEMQTFMTEKNLRDTYDALNLGNLVKSQGWSETIEGNYTILSSPSLYENASYNFNVSFEDQVIIGFTFSKYDEKERSNIPSNLNQVAHTVEVNDMSLNGMLTLPKGQGPFPCVILVHGSGASDMDETIFVNKPFRDIAWQLAENGIASYRYDKSVYAYPEKFATAYDFTIYDETVNDAIEISRLIGSMDQVSDIYILGHSLGGYAIPMIAKNTDASGYIIMAGNTRPIHHLIGEQTEYLLGIDGTINEEEQGQIDAINERINRIDHIDEEEDTNMILGAYKAYWSFLKSYDPIKTASAINEKVLVLQGKRDYQVTMDDYAGWLTFENKNNWSFKLYEDLNHLMMSGEGLPSNQEYNLENQVSNQVILDIVEWIKNKNISGE